ncbi:BTB/POZ domain containing protein [Acanthamoeba castellanii str. Neff]|uniref:BTB/POZ domain containing protein n=1 Tax=Acanthamoeba castellanii (strain ATCC 30010 / Neff) TaxID=1257118 RepID=L8H8R2_ACACF|nr:BTB/POZ domain containing protein [Acanthamoeba castellanii str. Neff]ELR20861.1 BTB/POZ domain containing protein [Acanthamoeba castellanii str. Neff]
MDRNLTDEGTSPSKRVEPSNRLKKPPGSDEEISSSGIFYKMMGEGALTSLGYSRSSPGREGRGPAMFPPHDGEDSQPSSASASPQPKKKRSWIDRFMQKDGRHEIKKEIAETEALRKSRERQQHQQQQQYQQAPSSSPPQQQSRWPPKEERPESSFCVNWRAREELYRKKIEELTEAEIRANIQFYETSDLLVLVKSVRGRNDHAAFRILQRHLEELYLLKHILYERGFYLNSTDPPLATGSPDAGYHSQMKDRKSHNLHIRCEAKTTKNLAETESQTWFSRSARKIYAEVNYHNDVLELYQRCIDVLEFADIESRLDSSHSHQYDAVPSPSTVSSTSTVGLRDQLLSKLFLDFGEYFLWCGDYVESAQALVRALVETAGVLAKLPPNIPPDGDKDIISLFNHVLNDHSGPYSLHIRFRVLAWVIARLRYYKENKVNIEGVYGLLRILVRLFNDDNKHVRQLAKGAVSDFGDRVLRIVDNATKDLFKEYHVFSAVLKERSEFFQRMLESEMMEGQPEEPITIQVDNPRVFHAAIEYLYTQQIILNEENAVDVLMCANQYSFTDLLHLVEDFLCVHLQSSSLEETEHLYHVTEGMVCPRLQGILRQRLRYLFEKTIVNSDHEKFVSMAHDYPILKRQLFFTDHYLCLSLYTGNKNIAMSMLSWGVGIEHKEKEKKEKKKGSSKSSKGSSKSKPKSRVRTKGKDKQKTARTRRGSESESSPHRRRTRSGTNGAATRHRRRPLPPAGAALSEFGSPSPPSSPRLHGSQLGVPPSPIALSGSPHLLSPLASAGPARSPPVTRRDMRDSKDKEAQQQRDPMLGCVTIHELKKKEKKMWKGWEAPLLIAIRRGYPDIVKILLDGDADTNVFTHSGKTPLELAVKRGKSGPGSDIVGMLVEAGSDVNRRRTKKAQEQPVFNEDMYVVHFEREKYNAIFDIKNTLRKDTTPLMVAAQYGHMQVKPISARC